MKTITRVYDTYAQARRVVDELRAAGVPEASISLVANKHVSAAHDDVSPAGTGAGVGAAIGGGAGLLTGLGIMAIPGVGPVVAAGWLVSTLVGAAAGAATGGIVGALVGAGESKEDAEVYSEAVRRGGTLVTVKAEGADADKVRAILDRAQPIDAMKRRDEYKKAGWKGYDPKAPAYAISDTERERMRAPYSL
jgi:hypothetical protein